MKHLRRTALLVFALLIATAALEAAERKALTDVSIQDLTEETQGQASPSEGMNLVWWIPMEFWEVSLSQDSSVTAAEQKDFIDAMRPYQVFCVVRADVSRFGRFTFHDKSTVEQNMDAKYVDAAGTSATLQQAESINVEAQALLAGIQPVLQAAIGPMGQNMHMFVFEATDEKGQRIASPYEPGKVIVELKPVGNEAGGTVSIQTPLDALHVPRICTKCQEKARVHWKFCPWCGTQLPAEGDRED